MLIFIYGDNIVLSRKKLSEILEENKNFGKAKFAESINSVADFNEITKSESLFESQKIVVFENFFKGKSPKWKTEIDFKKLEANENIFIFWEDADLNALAKKASVIANRKNVFDFKIPNLLWNFLDEIVPSVGVAYMRPLQQLSQILKTVDENYLFLMIVRQFRLLILSKEKFKDYPSDYKRLTFQKYKLASQASHYSLEELLAIYKRLLVIEANIKTGKGIYDLKTEIEKFIISL